MRAVANVGLRWLVSLPVILSFLLLPQVAWPKRHDGRHAHARFKTEPQIRFAPLEVKEITSDRSTLGDGYIFLTQLTITGGFGPQILDLDGNLVWDGNGSLTTIAQDLKVCDYLGELGTHLCWHDRNRKNHKPFFGNQVILDNTYTSVGKNYMNTGELDTVNNAHEFNMLDGGEKFLQAVYVKRPMDLRAYCGKEDGYVSESCFQEVDVRTGNITFQWCFLDHHPVWNTHLYFRWGKAAKGCQTNLTSPMAGNGIEKRPWDYFHINAIDKNAEGDYIVSARHLDQIIKVAGPDNVHGLPPGTTIWRLGGEGNNFTMQGNFNFSKQHHTRFRSLSATEETISFFDNAWEGANTPTAHASTAKFVVVNNDTMTASLVSEYHYKMQVSRAQGSVQQLPNGNVLTGWGFRPFITEHSPDGTLLYAARMWPNRFAKFGAYSYRIFRYPWTARPAHPPKVLAYSKSCTIAPDSPLYGYASWNGATEVASWRFSVADSSAGPWLPTATVARDGFETRALLLDGMHGPIARVVRVAALAANGSVLGEATGPVFVPRPGVKIKHMCNEVECRLPHRYEYPEDANGVEYCPRRVSEPEPGAGPLTFSLLVALFLAVEVLTYATQWYAAWTVDRRQQPAQGARDEKIALIGRHEGAG